MKASLAGGREAWSGPRWACCRILDTMCFHPPATRDDLRAHCQTAARGSDSADGAARELPACACCSARRFRACIKTRSPLRGSRGRGGGGRPAALLSGHVLCTPAISLVPRARRARNGRSAPALAPHHRDDSAGALRATAPSTEREKKRRVARACEPAKRTVLNCC